MFYKLLGMVTWKALRLYLRQNVPTRKIAAGAVVGTAMAVAIGVALQQRQRGG